MSRDFILPDLGEGLTEAAIVTWLVDEGDEIAIDQPVIEVESAKSVVELPSPFGGVVEQRHGDVGDVITAGTPLLTMSDDKADAPAALAPTEAASPVPSAAAQSAATEDSDSRPQSSESSGAVLVGYGTREPSRRARRSGTRRFGRGGAGSTATTTAGSGGSGPGRLDPDRRSPVVSPIVRRLARENGFDASQLLGSGPDNLVMRRDIEEYLRDSAMPGIDRDTAPVPGSPRQPVTHLDSDTREAMDALQVAAAAQFTRSRTEIPEATIWLDVDATALLETKRELEAVTGERYSLTSLLARFAVAGLRRFPVLNSSVDTAANEIVRHGAVNLGIAAQTPRGLMVPVVHGAGAMTLGQLRDGIGARIDQAKSGTFPPDALRGGTFTLNNFGSLGVDGSAAIINHPEVAILGIGRMIERPWVVNHELVVRTVVELSFVFDHRVCDGATAAGFLTYVARCIEHPLALLADL